MPKHELQIIRFLRICFAILILLPLVVTVCAGQAPASSTNSLQFESLDDWLNDNIDPDVLRALGQLDQYHARKIFSELQQAMAGTNIYQLGALRETAAQLIPILGKFEETAPYGAWLQTRLDYLAASQEMERELRAAMAKSGVPVLSPAWAARMQSEVWTRRLKDRQWPSMAKSYVPRLKKIFVEEQTPPELVWVAEVESDFNPKARSPAGAAGMFQLIPQTARDEHLSLWPWDQRLKPEDSARAAAHYLRSLHSHFGNWPLALAAYNTGEGRVDKLLQSQKSRTFASIARRLPAETQMYVPKVEATIRKREGRNLENLKNPTNQDIK